MLLRINITFIVVIVTASMALAQLKADFSASATSGCLPLAVSLRDQSEGNPDRWLWDVGDGRSFTLKDPGFVYLLPGSYTIKLTIYKGDTDSASITKTSFINVYEFPKANFEANPLEGCNPLPVRFRNLSTAGSGTIVNNNWDFGDGNSESAANPIHNYKITGLYSVTLSVTNSFGCRSSFTIPSLIKIYDTVKARFSYIADASCEPPFNVRFKDESIGVGLLNQKWDFGDGNTSTEMNPVYSFPKTGIYTITLIKFNDKGCSDTIKRSINLVTGNFSSSFEAPVQVCRGPVVTFKNTSTPLNKVDSVLWDFGDGTFSRSISPEKGFGESGTFTVKQTSFFGTCAVSSSKVINILPSPRTAFSGAPLESCKPPLTVNFKNETVGGKALRWRFGSVNRNGLETRTHVFDEEGVYSVRLITENDEGCLDTLVKPDYVKIIPLKILRVPGLPFEGCFPFTQTMRPQVNSLSPIVKWEWDFGDGRTSNEENPRITYNARGVYTLKLRVTNEEGCIDEAEFTVKGGVKPKLDFTADPLFVCTSGEVSFIGTVKGPYTDLLWKFGDGGTAKDTLNPINAYKDTGFMNVVFYAFDFGCVDSVLKTKYIYVSPPYAEFRVIANCNNRYQRVFKDSSFGGEQWLWDFGDGQTSTERNPTYTYAKPGTYRVKLTVTTGECFHEKTENVVIMDDFPDFEAVPNSNCAENIITFNAKGKNLDLNNIENFTWRFSDDRVYRDAGPSITRRFNDFADLQLRLTITDLNGCTRFINKHVPVILGGPKARIKPDSIVACVGSKVIFPDSSASNPNSAIIKWTWNFGNGLDLEYTEPKFETVYHEPGIYDLRLKVEDTNGCIDSIVIFKAVSVYQVKADFYTPDTIICPNTIIDLFNQSTGIGLKYLWDFGDGTSSTLQIPEKKYEKNGLFDVKLKVTDTANCVSTLERIKYIDVGGIKAKFEISDSFASCPPLFVSFTNQSIGGIGYAWDFGNGNSSVLDNPVHTYTSLGDFSAQLIVSGKGGCTDTAYRKVLIQGPAGEITYTPLSGCPPLEVKFSSSTENVKTYIWDFSDGNTIVTPDSTVTNLYLNPGIYRPRIILEDGDKCRISIFGKEEIKVVGVRAFIQSLPTYLYCDSALIRFADSSLTNDQIKSWKWDFGDGSFSDKANPEHLYNVPGRYNVSLFVETFDNCNSFYTLPNEIVIAGSPNFEILSDSSGCLPVEMQFRVANVQDTTSIIWNWDFGNGQVSELEYPEKTFYNTVGKYFVSLTALDNYGCKRILVKEIDIFEVPSASIAMLSQKVFCDSATILFTPQINSTDPIRSYRWDFGNGTISSEISPTNTYNKPGRYIVELQVETINGCTDIQKTQEPIIIAETPRLSIAADTSFCIPNKVFLSAQIQNPDTSKLAWQWNLASVPDATNINSKVATPGDIWIRRAGNYPLQVIVENEFGCKSDISRVVSGIDTPNIMITTPPFVCRDQPLQLTATGADSFLWEPREFLSCYDCPNPIATLRNDQIYQITGFVENGIRCERKKEISVRVIQPQNVIVSRGDTLCVGESYQIIASGASRYQWYPSTGLSASNIPNPLARPDSSINYILIASDTFNCFSDTLTVPIVVYPKPKVTILERTLSGNIGDRFLIQTTSSNVTRWRWTPTSGLSCNNCPMPEVSVLQNVFRYKVNVSNPGGCEASDEVLVEPICKGDQVYIPNTFSPNGDGRNDVFYPMSSTTITLKSLRVFNRWGQMVYERNNLNTNDPSGGWNGTFKGAALTPDVYVYIAIVPCYNNQTIELKGNVTLLK